MCYFFFKKQFFLVLRELTRGNLEIQYSLWPQLHLSSKEDEAILKFYILISENVSLQIDVTVLF